LHDLNKLVFQTDYDKIKLKKSVRLMGTSQSKFLVTSEVTVSGTHLNDK